jgi:hypothetical protein
MDGTYHWDYRECGEDVGDEVSFEIFDENDDFGYEYLLGRGFLPFDSTW